MEHLGPRISVIGNSGSGKTTAGRALAERLGVPFVEMDAIRHGPNWTETPDDEFRCLVDDATSGDAWVVDGNYTSIVRELVWGRATGVVWLDLPRWVVMRQVIWRSLWRAVSKRPLWNGNRELFRFWFRWDHPIRWAWSQHARKLERDGRMLAEPRWSHLTVARLTSKPEVRAFLDASAGSRS